MDPKTDLRLFRKANGITQGALAEYLGVTKQFISQVESGKNALPDDKLMKILDNPEWSMEKYIQLVDTFDEIKRAHERREGKTVAGETAEQLFRVRLIPYEARGGLIGDFVDGVHDYIWGKVTVPDLTTRDGRN